MENNKPDVGRPEGGRKINDIKLMQLRREGKSRQQCAEFFGVTDSAIKAAEKRIHKDLKNTGGDELELHGENIDSMAQLKMVNERIVTFLNRLDKLVDREEIRAEALEKVQVNVMKKKNDIDAQEIFDKIWSNNLKSILAIQTNAIYGSAEIRKQIELQLKIAETLYNLQMIQEFQSEIITILKEVDSIVAQKLINKLKERRTIRGLIKMNP